MKLPSDTEIAGIACGKEFGLIRGSNGKVYYYGKSSALGLKSMGKTPSMKPIELLVSKPSNIIHATMGHDGMHAILINDDGSVYFAGTLNQRKKIIPQIKLIQIINFFAIIGTSRRGEDGDPTTKNRRQPKAVKPKKIPKMDSYDMVHASCNNGTSALVTNTGKLIMLGKDTSHCDSNGFVTDIMNQHVTKVALGKAHTVVLNNQGEIFTFGMNNKGQCGRSKGKTTQYATEVDFGVKPHQAQSSSSANPVGTLKFDVANMCDFEEHNIVEGQCQVCTICRECTGYNVSCVTTQKIPVDQRAPGA